MKKADVMESKRTIENSIFLSPAFLFSVHFKRGQFEELILLIKLHLKFRAVKAVMN